MVAVWLPDAIWVFQGFMREGCVEEALFRKGLSLAKLQASWPNVGSQWPSMLALLNNPTSRNRTPIAHQTAKLHPEIKLIFAHKCWPESRPLIQWYILRRIPASDSAGYCDIGGVSPKVALSTETDGEDPANVA